MSLGFVTKTTLKTVYNKNLIAMKSIEKTIVTVGGSVNMPVEKVWNLWTDPKHIIKWNSASDDWHTPKAENDLRVGGRFLSRMESKDGKEGFDFSGKYSKIELYKCIDYTMDDNRKTHITFESHGNKTKITESFETETENPVEMQRMGWQSILDNFIKYAEKSEKTNHLYIRNTIHKGGRQYSGTNA